MIKARAATPRRAKARRAAEPRDDTQRIVEMMDLATEAKRSADHLGEKFLAYLLAMALQEMSHIDNTRSATRSAKGEKSKPTAAPADHTGN